MSTRKMHADELDIDVSLVRQLVAEQFPQWLDLPVARVPSAGTDNAIFRLGDDLAVRMPRRQNSTPQIDKEQRWLPRFAPHLPLAIPAPIARGEPAHGFPWRWSVLRWLDGRDGHATANADSRDTALSLAAFVTALARIDPADGPPAGPHNFYRGAPLVQRDGYVRRAIAQSAHEIDAKAATRAWDAALAAPPWHGAPTWLHGDLAPGNLLFRNDRLVAVLDFGCLGVGDPACELIVAWNLLSADTRAVYRAALAPDDATWARGRGWALSSVVAIPYYRETNPTLADQARHTIAAVLSESDL
jgi:aminoglycoside phosphotransferase (APT) family kinase protein